MDRLSALLGNPAVMDVQATVDAGRRRLLKAGAVLPVLLTARLGRTQSTDFWSLPRELTLERNRTGETIREVYWYDGRLHVDGYVRLCRFFCDRPANPVTQAVQMDLVLFDILRGAQGWLEGFGIPRPLILDSGYRTPEINRRTEGAVRNSFHTHGRAADIRIEGVSAEAVSRFGLWLGGGGVGFYQAKHFTHLDSGGLLNSKGALRFWRG
ncbi:MULTISPECIES: YcbK family protein [unclassified Burkholderia]|uniref:YcbK family protein n=1 Tax=unclassified Burkholderia TaxID=2613784 RepID=UPI002AB315AD|nr:MULTISPECIES: DUF882 domain-containing protein [unclassified Burkholderia]